MNNNIDNDDLSRFLDDLQNGNIDNDDHSLSLDDLQNGNINNDDHSLSLDDVQNEDIGNDDHSLSLDDLQNKDIHALVSTFVQSDAGQPLVGALVDSTTAAKAFVNLQRLINQLLPILTNRHLYNRLFNAVKAYVKVHPWSTASLIIGIVLLCNPLAMAGFGSLGPVAGSLAAAWQSSMGGSVAAGSAFAILQSWGMLYSIAIPVTGTIITAGSVAAATVGEKIREVCTNPVANWWNGIYGDPVTRWWKGAYGSLVAGSAANLVTKE